MNRPPCDIASRAARLAVRRLAAALVVAAMTFPAGCVGTNVAAPGIASNTNIIDGNASNPVGEPNNTFAQAIAAVFSGGVANLVGTIEKRDDVDVFDLGALSAGDRIVIDVNTPDSALDSAVALFDGDERLVIEQDDEDLAANKLDPRINIRLRRTANRFYLAIAASPFAASGTETGAYAIEIIVTTGGTAPSPRKQVLLLDFDGGSVDIPGDQVYTIGAFDAADIDPTYNGQTDQIKTLIRNVVEDRYSAYDVEIVTTDDPNFDPSTPHSSIVFGGFSAEVFGIAQGVDRLNSNSTDQAIVFTETFNPQVFGRVLTVQQLGRAIGQVAAHEAGHLLGLNHVADVTDLMDTTGAANTLLDVQIFKRSVLDATIFPIGDQDGPILLEEIVGPAAGGAPRSLVLPWDVEPIADLPPAPLPGAREFPFGMPAKCGTH